jgi:hypothetical protein
MSTRVWFARDTGFTADPRVQLLGDEYGPGGPLVLEEMMALAKLRDNGGSLYTSYATLARRTFVTALKVRKIVAASAVAGLIELHEEGTGTFTASFPRWSRWQPKDPTAAARKSRERAAKVTL